MIPEVGQVYWAGRELTVLKVHRGYCTVSDGKWEFEIINSKLEEIQPVKLEDGWYSGDIDSVRMPLLKQGDLFYVHKVNPVGWSMYKQEDIENIGPLEMEI